MAGVNKILKDGQVLFRAGDESDGMYIVRRGGLTVYLEQEEKEVKLASVGSGAMIGEMALFDKQPRSASVKADGETEITQISNADFQKLMRQIPKWFVGLMATLSTRLRETNERCQRLERGESGSGRHFESVIRMLNVLVLLWHKDGEKDGKEWTLPKSQTEKALVETFGEDPDKVKGLFKTLVQENLLSTKKDSYNNVMLATSQRGQISVLANFIGEFTRNNPKTPALPTGAVGMLAMFEKIAGKAPYDSVTASVDDLIAEGKKFSLDTTNWKKDVAAFKKAGDGIKLVKTSDGVGLKSSKKELPAFVRYHKILTALHEAKLA